MDDLIAKLEAADEGSRELDADVAETQGWSSDAHDNWTGHGGIAPPYYTTSLDAALKLVPEGWGWMAEVPVPWGKAQFRILRHVENGTTAHQAGEHDVDKPALALCIAALKARQTMAAEPETLTD